ncbi:hypothetical protein CLAIMM_12022 [Cladophialophora immunda]|nr:hypothetical protein CLAIMM_12022 [Cladophialophora immunda]
MGSAQVLKVIPTHSTFTAEVEGVDWSSDLSDDVFQEIQAALDQYGVLVCRNAGLDDARHIAFAKRFGELDDMSPHVKNGYKLRIPVELFDISNIDSEGNVFSERDPAKLAMAKGNTLWHADLAFNARRTGVSILRAHKLPPKGTGGETEFLDARQAYDDLSSAMKDRLEPLVANNSLMLNRKMAAPDFFKDIEPEDFPMAKHKIVVPHPASGRKTLYLTTYCHHFDGMSFEESQALLDELWAHCTQPKYRKTVEWQNDGDLVMWDNTAVLHRAQAGAKYIGRYPRDMRRASVFDMGPFGWGLNDPNVPMRQGLDWKKAEKAKESAEMTRAISVQTMQA